jgi:hypothetical protein
MLLQQRQQLVKGLWVCSAPLGETTAPSFFAPTHCAAAAAAGPAAGTSSVLVCALLQPLMAELGMSLQQRQQLVKGLLGTHAHEMTSMTQQLLLCYDQEAGRRCGLKVRGWCAVRML